MNGFGVPVNRDHGLKLADIACQAGNEDACDGVYDRPAIFAEPEPSKVKPIEDNRVQFTSSLVEAGPMKLKNVVCKFDNGAMTVPLNMVDTLAKHKPRFDACGAKMDVAMSWSVQLGALPVVDVESTEEKVGECVKHVFSSIEGLPFGVCSAELPPSVTAEVETPDVKKK